METSLTQQVRRPPVAVGTLGVGASLSSFALSILGVPRLVAYGLLAVGIVLMIVGALWWYQDWYMRRGDAAPENVLASARPLIATELRAIRYRIELVRSTRPNPHYSHGFRLPAQRWNEYKEQLAADPELYRIVGRAYESAWQLNSRIEMRETRANPGQVIGVTSEDGLNEVYDAAGQALGALGDTTPTLADVVSQGIETGNRLLDRLPDIDGDEITYARHRDDLKAATAWEQRVYDDLCAIGGSYAARFRNEVGHPDTLAPSGSSEAAWNPAEMRKLLQRRVLRLEQFANEQAVVYAR